MRLFATIVSRGVHGAWPEQTIMPSKFKERVRARMQKTGETWQQAARHVRAEAPNSKPPVSMGREAQEPDAPRAAADMRAGLLSDPRQIEQDDVLYDYALAELLEPRHNYPGAEAMAKVVARGPTPAERQGIIRAICAYREPMLGFLLRNNTRWFEARLSVDELATVRLTSWFEQPKYQTARTIDGLLRAPGASDYTLPGFSLDAIRGHVILVAPDLSGPLCLIEGTSRCCEIVRRRRSGEIAATHLSVFVGICENISEYTAFQRGSPVVGAKRWWVPGLPEISVKALLDIAVAGKEGLLVAAVAVPWFEILDVIRADPRAAYEIDWRKWEEIIAGAYVRAGFDDVVLTPRSGDKGRDVVATRHGVGSIRIFDQVKAYKPGLVVTAEEVRAVLGVITGAQNVSKGVITTTSTFAPQVMRDDYLAPYIPHRLELKPRDVLLPWLDELASRTDGRNDGNSLARPLPSSHRARVRQ